MVTSSSIPMTLHRNDDVQSRMAAGGKEECDLRGKGGEKLEFFG